MTKMHRPGSSAKGKSTSSSNGFKISSTTASPAVPLSKSSASTKLQSTDSFTQALAAASTVGAATLANLLPEVHVNLFCLAEWSGDLVFVGAKGRVHHINIYTSKPVLRELTPSNSETVFNSATRLSFNRTGTKILVESTKQAKRSVYVFDLPLDDHRRLLARPNHVKIHFLDGSSRIVPAPASTSGSETSIQRTIDALPASERSKVKTVCPEVFEIELRPLFLLPTVSAQAAVWHPLSDSHVAVLTSTDELLLFATTDSTVSPEQTHVLTFPPSPLSVKTTAISFGPSTGWELFTCYILRSNGDIYALNPIVPSGCAVSTSLLRFLHQKIDGQLTQSALDLDARILLKAQKHWFSQLWPHLPPAKTYDDDDDDSQGGSKDKFTATTVSAQVVTEPSWPLALQGPFAYGSKWKNEDDDDDQALSIACVPHPPADNNIGQTPVLAVSFASGHVTLLVLEREVRPQWRRSAAAPTTSSSSLSIFTVECLNLGATNANGKLDLVANPSMPRVLYCFHSTGVHVLHFGWMEPPLAPPFTSAVHRVFSISPETPKHIVGSRVLCTVERGHVLVVFLSNGQWELINLSAKMVAMPSSTPKTTPEVAKHDKTVTPFSMVLDKLQAKYVTSKLRVSGATALADTTAETFKFAEDHMPHLSDQFAYVEAVIANTNDRIAIHKTWSAEQTKTAAALSADIDTIQSSMTTLQKRAASVAAKQNQLNQRAAAILQALKDNQAVVTKAEKKYKQDLLAMQQQTRRLVPKVTQLNMDAQALLRKQPAPTKSAQSLLTDDKARMCHDVIAAETQLIADTTARLHDLTHQLEDLRV
ncbi:unnamed protein product [Aphanomyces euteiches]